MPIRVYLVDSQEVFRTGLALAYANVKDVEVVGQQSSLIKALDEIATLAPDVVVADWPLDRPDTSTLIRRLGAVVPKARVLIFTAVDTVDMAQTILDCGASGYLVKDASLHEVLAAVHALHAGRLFISHRHPGMPAPKSLIRARGSIEESGGPTSTEPHVELSLSDREQQVVGLLAEGLTNKQVAEKLYLSVKTVETYRSRIMKKHGLRGRADLFRFAKSQASGPAA